MSIRLLCYFEASRITSRIFPQKSISSVGKVSHFSFKAGHLDSKTNSAIEPSSFVYWKGRFCHTSSAKWGNIGAITLTMESRCAARTVWQLLLVKLVVPLKENIISEQRKIQASGYYYVLCRSLIAKYLI